jgi:hypothetical protein
MKQSTLTALAAILEADPPRTNVEHERLASVLQLKANGARAGDRLLTFEEAAARLGRKPRAIFHLARRGVIKKFRLPGSTRCAGVRASDIDALLAGGVA